MKLAHLPWDSELFGFSIARVIGTPDAAALSELACASGVRCAYWTCSAQDAEAVRAAELSGFRLVDIRVTLDAPIDSVVRNVETSARRDDVAIDAARSDDVEDLRPIAAELSTFSRFACDPAFGIVQARRLYDRWIEVSLAGRADLFVVARDHERILGFITCRVSQSMPAMELVAVRGDARGASVGTTLVRRVALGLRAEGHQTVEVVTQGRNTRAVRFYEHCGFRARQFDLAYHRWFDAPSVTRPVSS